MSYTIVKEFEKRVAEYAGSRYAIAVDSCTNALLLCCKYFNVDTVTIPCKTYVGVACSIIHAGGKLDFSDYAWKGTYQLEPYPIVDSARRFTKGMYLAGTYHCLSFHWSKHLPIGRGGMILTDYEDNLEWFRKMRFDGRTEGVAPKDDKFLIGYHFYMTPEQAARGLMLMSSVKDYNEDLIELNYSDLSKSDLCK